MQLMKWNCSSEIFSYSHKLDKTVFEEWNKNIGEKLDSPMLFHYKDEKVFVHHFFLSDEVSVEDLEIRAFMMNTSMMVAFNIGNPGAHLWRPPLIWQYTMNIEHRQPKIGIIPTINIFSDRKYQGLVLDKESIKRAELIWTVMPEIGARFFFHYIKAMNLLSVQPGDFNYYEEIFLNFWKALERFISVEYRKNKKDVDDKEIKRCLSSVYPSDFWSKFEDDFDELYRMRGNTAAHSYGKEKKITFEETMKVKVMTDFFIYKVLRARANKQMEEMIQKPEEPDLKKLSKIPKS